MTRKSALSPKISGKDSILWELRWSSRNPAGKNEYFFRSLRWYHLMSCIPFFFSFPSVFSFLSWSPDFGRSGWLNLLAFLKNGMSVRMVTWGERWVKGKKRSRWWWVVVGFLWVGDLLSVFLSSFLLKVTSFWASSSQTSFCSPSPPHLLLP